MFVGSFISSKRRARATVYFLPAPAGLSEKYFYWKQIFLVKVSNYSMLHTTLEL